MDDEDGMTPTREGNVNVFDDEFEVDDSHVVADGFRPGQSHDRGARQDRPAPDEEGISVAAHYATDAVVTAGPSRTSLRKSRGQENPFSSPDDEEDEEAPLTRTPSGNFAPAIAHRSVSSASSTQYAGSSRSQYGAGGPSHPYAMYPQGTVVRTPSTTTASTSQPTRQSSSRYAPGPQHPYSLYPQNVSDDIDDEEDTAQNPVPVGFGLSQTFQRRRGPDGEEQDIIGVYGHAEQLPPYTRYPEDGPEKPLLIDVPTPPTALHSRAPVLGTDPGMSLMHTQLLPAQQQSMTDESDLQRQNSRLSRLSGNTHAPDDEEVSADTSLLSKKSWTEKSWSEKRRTRFCGIPFWWFIAIVGAVVFVGAVLGGALGGFAAGQKSGSQSALQMVASSTLYDASLITTATGVPPATGTFPLSLGLPQETESACLTNTNDRSAWSCDLVGSDQVWIGITEPAAGNTTGAFLFTRPGNNPSNQLSYGAQVSQMVTGFSPFLFVRDNDDPADGSAFYFQQYYNKLVVVPAEMIDIAAQKFKRGAYGGLPSWLIQKQYATPGDKPWFCYWNQTLMEGFIYKGVPAKIAPTPTSLSSVSSTSSSSSTTSAPQYPGSPTGASTTAPWSIAWADPADTVTTTVYMPTTSCTYTGAASDFPSWMKSNYPDYDHYIKPTAAPPAPAPKHKHRRDEGNGNPTPFQYLVKIEERRLTPAPNPVCVQYQVLDNYQWNVITDGNGQQIAITLAEQDPPYAAYQQAGIAGSKSKRGVKRTVPGGCHCQWMSGE